MNFRAGARRGPSKGLYSDHVYEYEAEFEVSEEQFENARQFAKDYHGDWSTEKACTNYALNVLAEAGVENLPDGRSEERVGYFQPDLEMSYPGGLAQDLAEREIGEYVGSEGTEGGGSSGSGSSGSSKKGQQREPAEEPGADEGATHDSV